MKSASPETNQTPPVTQSVGVRQRTLAPAGIDLSIVITVFNNWPATKACLDSICAAAGDSPLSTEIILSDDCSTDETPRAWQAYANRGIPIRYRCNERNLGYLLNANAGAKLARGRFLCLMNNDILVTPGWADGLIATLESGLDIGLVGPKFLDAEGNTQETGVMVFSDGVGHQLGVMTPPSDPRFGYVNDVHYCTMACAMMRTEQFRELGGYDERYTPAYYEDSDFCFRLAERGLRVVVDPSVRITHAQGGSYGGVESETRLRLMAVNQKKFVERWASRLTRQHPAPETQVHRLRSWARGESILFVWPLGEINPRWASGALRNWLLMKGVRKLGLHVVCMAPAAVAQPEDIATLHSLGIEYYGRTSDIISQFQELAAAHRIKAVVFSFMPAVDRLAPYFFHNVPDAIRIFDTVDLQFLRELRERTKQMTLDSVGDDGYSMKSMPKSAWIEFSMMFRTDITLVVSEAEAKILSQQFGMPKERICLVSNIHEPALEVHPFEEREGFSFIGYGKHSPNVDAIQYLASDLWPAIRAKLPAANLYIYGWDLPPEIVALDDPARSFHVVGYVQDHRAALQRTRLMLAPLRFGAGVKGKIGEALAVGTVTVTTPVGAEGMDSTGRVIAIGDTTERLAELAVTLHERQDLWDERSRRGQELMREAFSSKAAAESLIRGIERADRLRKDAPFWQVLNHVMFCQSTALVDSHRPMASHSLLATRVALHTAKMVDRLRTIQNRPMRWTLKLAYWTLTGTLREKVTERIRGRLRAR